MGLTGALGLRSIYRSSTGARGRATSAWLRQVRILPLPIPNAPFRELSAKTRMPLRGVVRSPKRSQRRLEPLRHNKPTPILAVTSTWRAVATDLDLLTPHRNLF